MSNSGRIKVSVVMCTYNGGRYLRQQIDSILAQTFSDFELILIDDESPDECPKICDRYAKQDKRIHVIHQKNRGGYRQREMLALIGFF